MLAIDLGIKLTPRAEARMGDYDNVVNVKIVGIDESPRERWESIPVKVQNY